MLGASYRISDCCGNSCDNELAGLGVASADAFHVVYDQRDAYPSSLDALNSRDKARLGWLHDIQAPWDLWWGS